MTPNDVKQNRKTIDPAATMAGRRAGSVTATKVRTGPAPRLRAASSSRGSSPRQLAPTTRTTTATLKKTCATTIAVSDPVIPSERNAVPTTTVGRTNGIVSSATTAARPRNRNRLRTAVAGSATMRVAAVESAACTMVNHTTWRRPGSRPTSAREWSRIDPSVHKPRARIAPTGQRKNTARNVNGPATSRVRAARATNRFTAGRAQSTRRSSSLGRDRCARG